jgi:hypothetical protein
MVDVRAFPKSAMSAIMTDFVLGDRDVRGLLRKLPLLPEERDFVERANDQEVRQAFAHARLLWKKHVSEWDDPDSLDAAVKVATAACDADTPRRQCTQAEVLDTYNALQSPSLTMAQLQRRVARVAELRAAPGYAGPTFAAPRRAPFRQGRLADLSPVRSPVRDPVGDLMAVARQHAMNGLPPLVGRAIRPGLPPLADRPLQSGGHDVGQKWLDGQQLGSYQFIRRSANALTIKAPVMIGGKELFVKVAALQAGDDPVRDAFNSLLMSAIVDPRTLWTADFIGVRACYDVTNAVRAGPANKPAAKPWFDGADDYADLLKEPAAAAQPATEKKKLFGLWGGAPPEMKVFGFKDDGTTFTHLALFYRNAPGETVDSTGSVTNHAVIDLLQRIVTVGTVHGMTHNDMHAGNVMRSKDGLRLIDYGRVAFRDLKGLDGDAALMEELVRLQRQVIKVQDATDMYSEPRPLKVAASDSKWDLFRGFNVPLQYSWIPDFITCTLWMQSIVSTEDAKAQFSFEDFVNEQKRVLRGMQSPRFSEHEIAAMIMGPEVDELLNDPKLAFLAPGMALYGMFMFYSTHNHFHLDKTLISGGQVLNKMIGLIGAGEPEATAMFEVVKRALDANGIVADLPDLNGHDEDDQYGGGLDRPDKGLVVVLDALDGVFADTMADNAEIRAKMEADLYPDTLSPPEPLGVLPPKKSNRPAIAQGAKGVVLPSAGVGLPSAIYPSAAGKHSNALADLGNNFNDFDTMRIGTNFEGGAKASFGLGQIALSCVVVAAAVLGSMS